MKKTLLKVFGLLFLASVAMTSCKDDDDPTENEKTIENIEKGVLSGTLEEDYTLDAYTAYNLTGYLIVDNGATLTIPAGTQITAAAGGTDVYIAIMMGAKIEINGSASSPVVMSSPNAEPGDWGGLTICGKGITTEGENVTAEVGDFKYGGTDSTDDSGSISYLVIKGTGAQINTESQYNGVSFYAVGSGTSVSNVAVINGSDDGVEFFGGAVSATNLFLQNNEDDAIDWTEGWSGSVTNAYVEHTIEDFSTVLEADGVNNNPTITNLTAVATTTGTALQFKKNSGATITGLSLTGYSTSIDMKDDGSLENVIIEDETADTTKSYNADPTVDPSSWTWIDAELVEVEELTGNVTGDVTLDASVTYRLTGSYIVQDGASLTIPAGTKIHADNGGTDVYIAVLMGGEIYINGSSDNPVVIASDLGQPGDWGGLTICGKGVSTSGTDVEAEVGGFIYGGTDNTDNSGSVTNLVIIGTGAQINEESQYNGVTLYTVGSGTTLENIAVFNGADDGIEFFGGAAEVTNMYVEDCEDDAIDWTEGWSGSITNTYIKHTIEDFSTAFEGDKANNNPVFTNVTAISTTGGTALQFKKQSGATITGLHMEGYDIDLDMKDEETVYGYIGNVVLDGSAITSSDVTLVDGETVGKYTLNSGKSSSAIDITGWTWISANL